MIIRALTIAALCSLTIAMVGAQNPQPGPVTIRAARVLDGRGGVLEGAVIELQGSKIARIDQRPGSVTYDLGNLTVLPGMIDVHVHPNWYFGPNGKYGEPDEVAGFGMDAVVDSARKMLMAGFTTVQSIGSPIDRPLRDAIAAGLVPGPRLLTSMLQIMGGTRTPEQLRADVRQARGDGADVIKFFASGS